MQLKRRHAGILCLVMLLLMINRVQAQQPISPGVVPLSAKEAVEYALANQTAIKSAKLDELIQLAKNKEVSGMALPSLSGTGTYQDNPIIQKQLIDASNFDPSVPKGTLVPFAFGLKYNAVGELRLNQTLFDPSVLVALQARKTLEELVRKNVQNTEVDVKESVYKTYYNVLSGNKAMSFLVENIVSMEKMLHEVKVSYDNGLVEKLDVDRMQVQLTNLKTEETKLKNMLEVSTALLKYQIGMPSKQQIVLTDSLSTSQIKEGLVTINDFNYTQRIDYQLVETQKKVYEYDLKRYKLNALPTLSLFGIGGLSRASNEFNYFNSAMWYGYVGYGLNLSIPIFNGFQRRRQVDQAFLAVKKAEVTMENMRQTIDFQQEQSTTTFRNNILTLEAQEKNMGLAQDVYKTTQIKYREGVGSSVEMSTAENDLLKAQNNYFGALYDAVVAKIEYLKSYGKL
jgi:outer membrane protein